MDDWLNRASLSDVCRYVWLDVTNSLSEGRLDVSVKEEQEKALKSEYVDFYLVIKDVDSKVRTAYLGNDFDGSEGIEKLLAHQVALRLETLIDDYNIYFTCGRLGYNGQFMSKEDLEKMKSPDLPDEMMPFR